MELERVKRATYSEKPLDCNEPIGYTKEEALKEANRCLQCLHRPCENKGCVASIAVPDMIKALRENNLDKAMEIIEDHSNLSRFCCRVCFQANQCEGSCTLGIKGESIAIGLLERYIGDNTKPTTKANVSVNKKVAIIGSGPAGLSCAKELRKLGFSVDIYEKQKKAGGVLRYGIPNYRLPNWLVDEEIEKLKDWNVNFKLGITVGSDVTFDELVHSYDGVFIGSGCGNAMQLGVSNEDHHSVYSAYEVLAALNEESHENHVLMKSMFANKVVKVFGGGNVAMDVARMIARHNPSSVNIVYRRSEAELPARKEEVAEAKLDGVGFELLLNPAEFIVEDNKLTHVKCHVMELGEIDEKGRRSVKEIPNTYECLPCDIAIVAIGGNGETYLQGCIELNRKNLISSEELFTTSLPTVFAGGDVVTGPLTVVSAMRQGKEAAHKLASSILKDG